MKVTEPAVSQPYDEVESDLLRNSPPEGVSDLEQDVEIAEFQAGVSAAADATGADTTEEEDADEADLDVADEVLPVEDAIATTGTDDVAPWGGAELADFGRQPVQPGPDPEPVTVTDPAADELVADAEGDLEAAIDGDELQVLYQPIVDAPTGRWDGVETLLRWNHPRAGAVRPELIVAAAERTGLSTTLGAWVLRRACRDMQRWRDSSPHPPAAFAVNVSARDVMDPDLCSLVMRSLEQSGLAPETLCIELTENALLEDLPSSLGALERLRQLGVRLALDDFGTGYSSLRYLKRFPVDMLKIDQSFVTDVGDDRVDAAIVGAIVELAHTLELTVVAEGVESPRQLERVRALHCDLVQGYLFSAPLPAEIIATRVFGARPGRFTRGRHDSAASALLPAPRATRVQAANPRTP